MLTCAAAAAAVFCGVDGARAASVALGASGWTATWDSSLDPYVDIHVVAEDATHVFIQKSAEFFQGPDGFGVYPGISIDFSWQPGVGNPKSIVIEDEIITNSTGTDWTDFHMDVVSLVDAVFNHGPGFFFTTSPFDNQSFTPDSKRFDVNGFGLGPGGSNAIVADGTSWFPGSGASDGELVIESGVGRSGSSFFTLVETPTPEPASLSLLALGAIAALRRCR
jgi:hypothetical protein